MGIIYLLVAAFLLWVGIRIYKSAKSSKLTFDDHHFKQGDVEVQFSAGTIKIKGYTYNVSQVTGISSEPYTSNRHGNSRAYKAIIEVDDLKKTRHSMEFFSRNNFKRFVARV